MEYFYLQNYIFNDTIYHTTEILKKTLNHGLYFITKLLSKLCMIYLENLHFLFAISNCDSKF